MKLNEVDLNKLHVFLTLAQKGTMKEAGKELLRTPSAISQSLARLEASLGASLFRRVGTRLILTEEGKELSQGLLSYQADLGKLLSHLSLRQQELSGVVRLGLPPGFPAARLGGCLERFLKEAPRAQLRLRFLSHADLADGLSAGTLDLALSLQRLDGLNRNLASRKLCNEELVLVCGGAHAGPGAGLAKGPRVVTAESLSSLAVIEYYQAPAVFEQWARHHFAGLASAWVSSGRFPPPRVYASTLEYVLELVRRGVGVAVVPREVVAAELNRGTLRELRGPRARRWMGSVWLNEAKSAFMSPASSRFREGVVASLASQEMPSSPKRAGSAP